MVTSKIRKIRLVQITLLIVGWIGLTLEITKIIKITLISTLLIGVLFLGSLISLILGYKNEIKNKKNY